MTSQLIDRAGSNRNLAGGLGSGGSFIVWGGDAVETFRRIKQVIERQPEASRMVEEEQRENDCEGNPEHELLVDRHAGENIEDEEAGHGDRNGGGIVDVNRADEIALLALEL